MSEINKKLSKMKGVLDHNQLGLYQKFIVQRTDERDKPGEKHHNCQYFVLDMTHDPFAIPALFAYLVACEKAYPQLSIDLDDFLDNKTHFRDEELMKLLIKRLKPFSVRLTGKKPNETDD